MRWRPPLVLRHEPDRALAVDTSPLDQRSSEHACAEMADARCRFRHAGAGAQAYPREHERPRASRTSHEVGLAWLDAAVDASSSRFSP